MFNKVTGSIPLVIYDFFQIKKLLFSFSAVLRPSGCELSNTKINHSKIDNLRPKTHTSYLEKFCIPSKLAKQIKLISLTIPKHILVGHVQEVVDSTTFIDCQLECLGSELRYGFVCRSAMWYPNDLEQVTF